MAKELSEEEVFANDIDPLDAIREIRKEEGVAEEDLIVSDSDTSSQEDSVEDDDEDELENLQEESESNTDTDDNQDSVEDNLDTESEQNSDEDEGQEELSDDPDEDAESDSDDKDTETPEATKRKFTADGKEYEFTEQEMLDQFEVVFGQAVNFTQKTQKMAPFRKMISALESEDISAEQLNVAIDALKGNKQALQTLMKDNNIDAYDINDGEDSEKDSYTPTDYGKNDTQLDIEEVIGKISSDTEYPVTVNVIDEQWDDNSRKVIRNNPNIISGLHNDIKSGVYDKVAPVAMKMKVLDGNTKSDLEYYMLAGEKVLSADTQNSANAEQTVAEMNQEAQGADDKFDQASSEAQRKRSSSSTRKRSDRKAVTNYLDDDDEAYDAWYKNLQASQ